MVIPTPTVYRDSGTNCLLIDDIPYSLSSMVEFVYNKLIVKSTTCSNGKTYHIYADYPPLFFSGSPYGAYLLSLGLTPLKEIPNNFSPEYLLKIGKKPAMASTKWATILGLDSSLYYCD